jgi:hypothetical protein
MQLLIPTKTSVKIKNENAPGKNIENDDLNKKKEEKQKPTTPWNVIDKNELE